MAWWTIIIARIKNLLHMHIYSECRKIYYLQMADLR